MEVNHGAERRARLSAGCLGLGLGSMQGCPQQHTQEGACHPLGAADPQAGRSPLSRTRRVRYRAQRGRSWEDVDALRAPTGLLRLSQGSRREVPECLPVKCYLLCSKVGPHRRPQENSGVLSRTARVRQMEKSNRHH